MAWVKIDEHFYDHPKWHDAPGDSIALWLAATAWCNRNDSTTGFIPEAKTRGLVNVKRVANTLKDLCERDAFHRVPGGYQIHDYEEYQQPEKVKEIATKRAAAGRKGAAHRWEAARTAKEHAAAPMPYPPGDEPVANGMANAIAKTCPDTDTDTDTENITSLRQITTSEVPDRRGVMEAFDRFWEQYPRHTDRKRASTAWRNLTATERAEALAALPQHVAAWTAARTQTQHIPHPTTWLHGKRWEDEIASARRDLNRTVTVNGAVIAESAW